MRPTPCILVVVGIATSPAAGCMASVARISSESSSIEIVSPESGALVSNGVAVRIHVARPNHVALVELVMAGVSVGRWSYGQPEIAIDVPLDTFAEGPLTVQVAAEFLDGTVATDSVAVRVERSGSGLEIVAPRDATRRFIEDGPFALTARLPSGSGVVRAVLRAGAEVVGTIEPVAHAELTAMVDPLLFHSGDAAVEVPLELSVEVTTGAGMTARVHSTVVLRSRLRFRTPVVGSIRTSPAVLSDGAIAVGTLQGWLYVINPDGSERCHIEAHGEQVLSGPVVLAGGSTVVWGTTQFLRATDGAACATAWTHVRAGQWTGRPALAADGTIYAATFDGTVDAISPTGAGLWSLPLSRGAGPEEVTSELSIGPDGTIYVGTAIAGGRDGSVYAVTPGGTVAWSFAGPAVRGGAVATATGVYFGAAGPTHSLRAAFASGIASPSSAASKCCASHPFSRRVM